LENPKICLNCN